MEDSNISTADNAPGKRAALRGREKLVEVQTIYAGLKQELEGDRFWRYQSQVSPGLQEYIEALGFAHYLEYGSLITFDQVQRTLADSQGVSVSNRLDLSRGTRSGSPFKYFPLTISDYLLGLSDLTGELMRYAISGISRRGGRKKASEVCAFVRGCKSGEGGIGLGRSFDAN